MTYLELNRRYEDIYYLDGIDFYLPKQNTIYLCVPFFNPFLSGNIIKKLHPKVDKYDIEEIYIITVSGEESIDIAGVEAKIITFYDWVLSL
jgi:hypothetical protein